MKLSDSEKSNFNGNTTNKTLVTVEFVVYFDILRSREVQYETVMIIRIMHLARAVGLLAARLARLEPDTR